MTHTFITVFCQSSFFLNCIPTFCENMFNISFDPIRIGNNKERILRTHLPINTPVKTTTAAKRSIFLLFGIVCKHAIAILTISENDLYVSLASVKSPSSNTSWLVVTSCVNLPTLSLSVFVNIKYKLT